MKTELDWKDVIPGITGWGAPDFPAPPAENFLAKSGIALIEGDLIYGGNQPGQLRVYLTEATEAVVLADQRFEVVFTFHDFSKQRQCMFIRQVQ